MTWPLLGAPHWFSRRASPRTRTCFGRQRSIQAGTWNGCKVGGPPRRWPAGFAKLSEGRRHDTRAFFKPADDKCFRAGIYASGAGLPCERVLPGDTPILIADVVVWKTEFRCFVLDRPFPRARTRPGR